MAVKIQANDALATAAEKIRLFGDNAELTADEFAAYKGWKRRYFDDQVRLGNLVPFGGASCHRRFHLRTNIAVQARAAGLKNDLIVTVLANPGEPIPK